MMESLDELFSAFWCKLVFQGRNQAYGAYELRRRYARTATFSLIFAVSFFVLAICSPFIIALIRASVESSEKLKITEVTTLAEPPPIDKNEPPPPPVEPPPPLKTTIKFTPPVIVKDDQVEEEPPPTQEELKEVEAGAKTQEGDTAGVDAGLLDNSGAAVVDDKPDQVFTIVEQMPEFPGGEGELLKFISKNIKYPAIAKDNGITGRVFVTFVVGTDGHVRDAKVLRGIGAGCDDEAVRVVKTLPPFKPGKQGGRPVSVVYNLPINFTLK